MKPAIWPHVLRAAFASSVAWGALSGTALAERGPPPPTVNSYGGALADAVVSGDYVYQSTGRTISTWSYASPSKPVLSSVNANAPSGGVIVGLVQIGDYLYGGWQAGNGQSGVTVYSLSKPESPERVADLSYADSTGHQLTGIVAANGYLYVFDANAGLYIGDVSDPLNPVFSYLGAAGVVTKFAVEDNLITASGRDFQGRSFVAVVDVTNPFEPATLGGLTTDSTSSFRIRGFGSAAYGFGFNVSVFDTSDPVNVVLAGTVEAPSGDEALDGLVVDHYAYSIGLDSLNVWNVADPTDIVEKRHLNTPTLGADSVAAWSDGGLFATSTDWITRLDASKPRAPKVQSQQTLPGGVAARDVVQLQDKLVVLQQNYGLTIADLNTLQAVGRFDADLPADLTQRDIESWDVVGNTAYLAAWGTGLILVDLSDLEQPRELGRVTVPFAASIEVKDQYAYLGITTNGTGINVVDVSDTARPRSVGYLPLTGTPDRLAAQGNYLFVALEQGFPARGLSVISIADPEHPVEVGSYSRDCDSASDLKLDESGTRVYLACRDGLRILDVTQPTAPVLLGSYPSYEGFSYAARVEQAGNRAWYGDYSGVYEFDVTNPSTPQLLQVMSTSGYNPQRLRRTVDSRLFAFTGIAGIQVFGDSDGTLPEPPGGITVRSIDNHELVKGLSLDEGEALYFKLRVPGGAGSLKVESLGVGGNVDIYVQRGSVPEAQYFDGASVGPGSRESVSIAEPQGGEWYIKLVARKASERVSLTASYQQ